MQQNQYCNSTILQHVLFFSRLEIVGGGTIQNVEALHYAVDQINRDPNILPSIKLGFDLYDQRGCGNIGVDDISELITLAGDDSDNIVGVIGPHGNRNTEKFLKHPSYSLVIQFSEIFLYVHLSDHTTHHVFSSVS